MIVAIIIWIFKMLAASAEDISKVFPKIEESSLEALQNIGVITKFDTLGITAKGIFWLSLGLEIAFEVLLFIKWLPRYISSRFERMRNRPIYEAEILKAIQFKIQSGARLSSKERKFYKKRFGKGVKYD